MHHQDFAGESAGTGGRKMSHPSGFHHRRGSSGTSAPSSAASGGGGNGDAIAGVESGAQAGSSSPGLHHQLQSQAAGAQVKKKSGFQITSVTSAQINVSANNSLADDTESYDDMDESHTEDLSSSDMLDVSVSRATDTGVPERSSSDETLNSLHGVDTPGLVSPNEPLHPQGSQPLASMMNGTLHQIPSHFHHHHGHQSDHPEVAQGTSPVAPSANSSPAMIPKAGSGQDQPQRITLVNNTGAVAGTTTLPAAAVGVPGAPPSGPTGFDSGAVGGQGAFIAGGAVPSVNAPNGQAPHSQAQAVQGHTQVTTGSRFRVVKLDTISEPFRKGRWTCTDYYEKEVPHAVASETPKGTEVAAAEPEVGNQGAAAAGPVASQPPQTLQPHQQPSQDFTSPQAMQSPPQPPPQNPPLAQMPLQELSGGAPLIQQPIGTMPLSAAGPQVVAPVMPHQVPSQMGYPATHLPVGVGGRQPDFIQPTAPFQTQVQQPLAAHAPAGVSMTIGHGGGGQPSLAVTQQLPLQGQGAPAAVFTPGQPQRLPAQPQQQQQHPLNPQAQAPAPSSLAPAPSILAPVQGTPYVPLTALQADLQPLLTPGATFSQTSALGQVVAGSGVPLRSSHLEDAQRLLFQHRLEQQAAGTLAHMGMAAEASALMVAAAAGLRVQPAEGDEDSSSGASVVAIDNKIEQAMDLVKSHLMYAVREEVEVLKEQIKELLERNSQLEQENTLLKTLASPEQMAQFQAQVQSDGSPTGGGAAPPPPPPAPLATLPAAPGPVAGASPVLNSGPSA